MVFLGAVSAVWARGFTVREGVAQVRATDAGHALDASTAVVAHDEEDEEDEDPEDAPAPSRDAGVTETRDAGCVTVDRESHCCAPGQRWRNGACAGATTSCAPGSTHDDRGGCVRRVYDRDGGASARLFAPAGVPVPATMVAVPGGVFRSGGRAVSVGPFAIDRREVTAAEWAVCVRAGVCATAPDPYGAMRDAARAPMVNVSWSMAQRYCGFVGARLPTETEWELAARGLDGRRYPWGARAPTCSLARIAGCGDGALVVGATTAGASPFGLVDMAGNVAEWTVDGWAPRASRDDGRVVDDPVVGGGERRVVRGGSFLSGPDEVTVEARRGVDAREQRSDVGFRCVRGL